MSAKRALIVDDSKSARLFLARVLQDFEIDVDSAESAEAAIDYLSSNRPDVIFMDHQMPGMDGLQAVQAIKNDPRTATIPIMMYTSQEGELYLGQARALGALGVLPKQIKPTDVSKVLYQLHLVPDRRVPEQSSFTPVGATAERAAGARRGCPPAPHRHHPARALRGAAPGAHRGRRHADRPDHRRGACAAARGAAAAGGAARRHRRRTPWAWIIAAGALAVALASTWLWWRSERALESLTAQVAQLGPQQRASRRAAGGGTARCEPPPRRPLESKPISALVPYGADALGGPRLEVIGKLLDRLARQHATGVVEIRTYAGRFCLMGNAQRWLLRGPRGAALCPLRRGGQPRRRGAEQHAAHPARAGQPHRRYPQLHPRSTGCSGLGGRSCEPRAAVPAGFRGADGRGVEPRRKRQQQN